MCGWDLSACEYPAPSWLYHLFIIPASTGYIGGGGWLTESWFFFSIIPSKYIITRHSFVKKSFSSPSRFLFNSSFIFVFIQGYTQLHKQGNCPKLGRWGAPSSWSFRPLDMTPFEHLLPFGHKTLQAHLVLPLLQVWIRHFSRSPDLLQWGMAFWGWHLGRKLLTAIGSVRAFQFFPRREKSTSFYSWVRMDISISNFTWPFFSNFSYLCLVSHVDNLGLSQRSSTSKICWHVL